VVIGGKLAVTRLVGKPNKPKDEKTKTNSRCGGLMIFDLEVFFFYGWEVNECNYLSEQFLGISKTHKK